MPATGPRGLARGGLLSDFRCAAASEARDEEIAGSASTVSAFLLVEHPGPWGVAALRDARWPGDLGPRLHEYARSSGFRMLLIRRPGRSAALQEHRVFVISARPGNTWAETAAFSDLSDLLDVDLAPLREGRSVGLTPHHDPVFAVCTHGRHDTCCAERGRPVAAALAETFPEQTWEVSHIGGDRFAANMLLAPDGLYYGRLTPKSALAVAEARMRGEVELDHLRGRTAYAMPLQAADIALRRHLGVTSLEGPRLVARNTEGELTTSTFEHAGARYVVRVRTTLSEAATLTCHAARDQHGFRHEVLEIVGV